MDIIGKTRFCVSFFLPSIRICQIFDTQRAQQGSEVFDADGERPQESQAVIWHRLVVPGSPRVVEELLDDLNSCGGKRRATSGNMNYISDYLTLVKYIPNQY